MKKQTFGKFEGPKKNKKIKNLWIKNELFKVQRLEQTFGKIQ